MTDQSYVPSRRVSTIVCLFISVALAGCSHFSSRLFTSDYGYEVSLPEKNGTFNFEEYATFAWNVANTWDSQTKLYSVARLVSCDDIESDQQLGMLFEFYRPRPYWLGQRIEWLDIHINGGPSAKVSVYTSFETQWDKPPVDISALTVGYSTALKMARDKGGTLYEASHSACYLRVVLVENQWNFEYMEDEAGVSDDKLRLCIDGITGEPCQFFYRDEVPSEDVNQPLPGSS